VTVVLISQARMTSTRLPGKVLKTVLGKSLLEYQIERLKRSSLSDVIVVATTTNATDVPIVTLCKHIGVHCYRGPEDDVLARFHGAAQQYHADVIVRVTADCPLIDPHIVDKVVRHYLNHAQEYDYISNSLIRSYPRGMDTEVFSMKALHEAFLEATAQSEREHVTPFIYQHPDRYRVGSVKNSADWSNHRWTVDTADDFELIRRIIETLYPDNREFNLEDVIDLIQLHPAWATINLHVKQKNIGE
jgi:spore coat polysaccharide biosynthesis protein SpsF